MAIFTWIVLGLAGLLLAVSAICWGIHLAVDNSDWRRLGVKIFRISMVFVLFYINAAIYAHIFGVFRGTEKPVPAILEDEAPQSLRSCPRGAPPGGSAEPVPRALLDEREAPTCSAFLA